MAIDVPSFKAAFPEFAQAPDSLVQAQLNYAIARVDPNVWGTLAEEGTFVHCARFLALSPYARKMGLVDAKDGGQTPYDKRLTQLLRSVTAGYRAL